MRVSIILLSCALALATFAISDLAAEEATPAQMERVCRNFLSLMVHEQGAWAGERRPVIHALDVIEGEDGPVAHCFHIYPKGHVIVPILMELPPIKAYSETSRFDNRLDRGFPQMIRDALTIHHRIYVDRFGSLEAPRVPENDWAVFNPENRKCWDLYLEDPDLFQARLEAEDQKSVRGAGPLLTSQWHQSGPFNQLCPMGNGGRCVVGCTPLATCQVLRYHFWPPYGTGDKQYYWFGDGPVGGGYLYADFSDFYDFGNMPNFDAGATQVEKNALSELCYEIGVAHETDYHYAGSSADPAKACVFLPGKFYYDGSIQRRFRNGYTAQTWFDMIKAEVDEGTPMIYSITGHCIVCDGWRELTGLNQYHINYGWGGPYSDWYTVDEIYGSDNPLQEDLIRNIIPLNPPTLVVDPAGGGDFTGIQDAIDHAARGVEIIVEPGTYLENVSLMGKPIRVRSRNGPFATVIDGTQSGPVVVFDHEEGPDTVFDGFTLCNGRSSTYGGGIDCFDASPIIMNNIVKNNTIANALAYGAGICCRANAAPLLLNNVVAQNQIAGYFTFGGGIALIQATATLTNNTVVGNAAGYGGGLYVTNDFGSTVTNCIFWDNTATGGGQIHENDDPIQVAYSDVEGGWTGTGNIDADPLFLNAAQGDFHLTCGSPCIDSGSDTAPQLPLKDIDGDGRNLAGSPPGNGKGLFPLQTGGTPPAPAVDMGADEYTRLKKAAVSNPLH